MKIKLKENKWTIILGLFIFLLGVFLRLVNLNSLPIFGDEAIYIRWAQVMRAEPTLRFIPLTDGKQPLFMWSVIPFLKVFSDPLIAGRLVSVLSGTGTLIGVFVLSYIIFSSYRISLIASFLYAVSPFSVFFDRMALADSFLSFFGVWAIIFSVIAVKKVRLDCAMLAGFFLGGALLTKSPAIFFTVLIPLSFVFAKWPKGFKRIFIRLSIYMFLFAFTYAIGYGLYNILRLGPNFHIISQRNADYIFPLRHILTNPIDPFKPNLIKSLGWFMIMGPGILLFFILFGTTRSFKKFRVNVIFLLAFGILTVLIQAEFAKVFTARYIFFSLPYLFIIASLFFNSKKLRIFSTFFLFVFAVWSLRNDFLMLTDIGKMPLPAGERSGYLEEWTAGMGIKEVSTLLREEYYKSPEKKIIVGTEGYFGTLPDGLQIYLNDIPEITVIGVGIDLKELPQSLIESEKSGNDTYLVINKSRLIADPRELNLETVAVYPKEIRKEGTYEYNIHGPQDSLYLLRLKNVYSQ